jgi:hypothetical protein
VIGATGAYVGYKMYTKPHRNVAEATAVKVSAAAVINEYERNEVAANTKYLDKVLEVNGEILTVTKNQKAETVVTLKASDMGGIICTLENATPSEIKSGENITIKGICTGYLTDVVLVRCAVQAK